MKLIGSNRRLADPTGWRTFVLAALALLAAVSVILFLPAPLFDSANVGWAMTGVLAASLGTVLLQRHMRRQLEPPEVLEIAVTRLEQGDLRARLPTEFADDPALLRLASAVNRLLDGMIADRQRLRELAARAFRAQEAERLRIARELQEETAQTLTTVLFQLRAARQIDEPSARDTLLDEARDGLMHTTDSLRRYARVLHPPSLEELGLVAALEGYARSLASSSGLAIQILADDLQGVLPLEGELALYRIVQEALGNVVRHAGAAQVLVRVRNKGGYVKTLIEDDGAGFLVEEAEARLPCLGLFGMRERALSVGGTVEIDSIPGDGTQVRIAIPIAVHQAGRRDTPWPVIVQRSDPVSAAGAMQERERGEPAVCECTCRGDPYMNSGRPPQTWLGAAR